MEEHERGEQHERDAQQERELALKAAFLALSDNCFWQQFCHGLQEKRSYLERRLREATDFAAFRYLCGQLEMAEQLLATVAEAKTWTGRDEHGFQ